MAYFNIDDPSNLEKVRRIRGEVMALMDRIGEREGATTEGLLAAAALIQAARVIIAKYDPQTQRELLTPMIAFLSGADVQLEEESRIIRPF